tara:strand:- start:251 stop:682 length:432 start_codon:yes stop_codon:yes gene_type:complete
MILNALIEKYGFKEGLDISGDKITKWPYDVAKPTKAKLKTILDEYKLIEAKENTRKAAKDIRNEALQNLTVELNGNVFQTRPSDEVNFRLCFESMSDTDVEEWILDDNAVKSVNKADLIAVYSQGLAQSKVIYQTYKDALKAL